MPIATGVSLNLLRRAIQPSGHLGLFPYLFARTDMGCTARPIPTRPIASLSSSASTRDPSVSSVTCVHRVRVALCPSGCRSLSQPNSQRMEAVLVHFRWVVLFSTDGAGSVLSCQPIVALADASSLAHLPAVQQLLRERQGRQVSSRLSVRGSILLQVSQR